MISLYGQRIEQDARQYQYFTRGSDVASPELARFLESIKLTARNVHSIHDVVWLGMDPLTRNHELVDPNKTKKYALTCILVKFMVAGKMAKIWVKRAVLQALLSSTSISADSIIYLAAQEQERREWLLPYQAQILEGKELRGGREWRMIINVSLVRLLHGSISGLQNREQT